MSLCGCLGFERWASCLACLCLSLCQDGSKGDITGKVVAILASFYWGGQGLLYIYIYTCIFVIPMLWLLEHDLAKLKESMFVLC